jgi:uncharacterized membrane protein YkvA (DUF1232 family)
MMPLREWARVMKRDTVALYLAARDPRVPWYAKAVCLAVAAYALSPIDLIPDFIPVFGYLDDIILVPAGIMLARRLIPPHVLAEHQTEAARLAARPVSKTAAVIIVLIWATMFALIGMFAWRSLRRQP